MFTGLIREVGTVAAATPAGGGLRLEIDLGSLSPAPGDSVAVDGCCLTVTGFERGIARFHLSPETISRTALGSATPGRRVNLEPALAWGDPLGGHLVLGHVDGVGSLVGLERGEDGGATLLVEAPPGLARFTPPKASVAIDGISLTVAARDGSRVTVALIPETLARTAITDREPGARLNFEVDTLARYAQGAWD